MIWQREEWLEHEQIKNQCITKKAVHIKRSEIVRNEARSVLQSDTTNKRPWTRCRMHVQTIRLSDYKSLRDNSKCGHFQSIQNLWKCNHTSSHLTINRCANTSRHLNAKTSNREPLSTNPVFFTFYQYLTPYHSVRVKRPISSISVVDVVLCIPLHACAEEENTDQGECRKTKTLGWFVLRNKRPWTRSQAMKVG